MSFLTSARRRWIIVAILFAAMMLNYIDRQVLSILKTTMKAEFGMDDWGYAGIANVFTIAYATMYPVSGWLVDRFGARDGVRRIMFGGILVWSCACIAAAFTRTAGALGFARGVLGAAEPTTYTAQLRAITEWFPQKRRATANSLCQGGSTIGMVLAVPMIVWLKETYDWRAAFIVPGVLGLVIAACWFLVYKSPPEDVLAESIGTASPAREQAFTWPQLWGTRALWCVILCRFISDPVWYFCLFWLPGYLEENSGFTLVQVGMFGWIPFLFAALGGIVSCVVSDRLVRGGMAPLRARKIVLTCLAAFMPVAALVPRISNPFLVIAIFSVVCAISLSWLFTLPVVVTETFPTRNVAGVIGIAAGCGAGGAVIFNFFVGKALGTIGPAAIFSVMGGLHLVACIILWTMLRKETPATPGALKPRHGCC